MQEIWYDQHHTKDDDQKCLKHVQKQSPPLPTKVVWSPGQYSKVQTSWFLFAR